MTNTKPTDAEFLSTPSARRATYFKSADYIPQKISIHALCEEGDLFDGNQQALCHRFLSTPSARRATGRRNVRRLVGVFLSTPSARRATFSGMVLY